MEIRNLRQRLEESICTNDRLREQLERRLASTGKASGTVLPAASLHSPLLTPCTMGHWGETQHCSPPQHCPVMSMPRHRSWGCS